MTKKSLCILAVAIFTMAFAVNAVQAHYKTVKGPTGVLMYDSDKAYNGYTIVTPYTATPNRYTYLLDMEGYIVHTWDTEGPTDHCAILTDTGTILRHLGGAGRRFNSLLQEYDWDSNLIREFPPPTANERTHHGCWRLPNGNTLQIFHRDYSAAEVIAVGRTRQTSDKFTPCVILEFDQSDPPQVVWEWDPMAEGIIGTPKAYGTLYANLPSRDTDFMHSNAVNYDPVRNWLLLTMNAHAEMIAIDKDTKQIVYRWGNPANWDTTAQYRTASPEDGAISANDQSHFIGNHDARWNPYTGNIMCFNNNGSQAGTGSIMEEIDPDLDEVVWKWPSRPDQNIYSSHQSSHQALPNGNHFMNMRTGGHVVEVTQEGEVVWEWISPFGDTGPVCWITDLAQNHGCHKTLRYGADHPGLVGKDLSQRVAPRDGCVEVWNLADTPQELPTVSIDGGSWVTGESLFIEVTVNGPDPYDVFAGFQIGDDQWYCYEPNMAHTTSGKQLPLGKVVDASAGYTTTVFEFVVPEIEGLLSLYVFAEVTNPGYLAPIAEAREIVNLAGY